MLGTFMIFFFKEKNCKISRDQIINILVKKFKIKLKNRYWPIHLGAIMRKLEVAK